MVMVAIEELRQCQPGSTGAYFENVVPPRRDVQVKASLQQFVSASIVNCRTQHIP
jgi:hypothetical protein